MNLQETFSDVFEDGKKFIQDNIKRKYCLKNEKDYADVLNRIRKELEKTDIKTSDLDYTMSMIGRGRFIPAGSISFGLGNTDVKCSLSNCYFTPIEQDSIEGIFEAARKLARTFSYRGGSGVDITILRPKNSRVNNAAVHSSGAVSFMPLFSNVAGIIGQNGRRGAEIIMMDVRHPDVLDFIWCKSRPKEIFGQDPLTGKIHDVYDANITVKLSDSFMKAVKDDEDWQFVFPDQHHPKYDDEWKGDYDDWAKKDYPFVDYQKIKARDILIQIAESAWISGDPGISYWDTVIKWTPGSFDPKLKPTGSNPCGEQPLADYNNCLLSALILHSYVINPYEENAQFNLQTFLNDIEYGVLFLDTLIDINIKKHPLADQQDADRYGRRIGLEFTGLGDCLAMLGLEYGSEESIEFVDYILYMKALTEFMASWGLAKEKGAAPCFETKKQREQFLKQEYIKRLLGYVATITDEKVQEKIIDYDDHVPKRKILVEGIMKHGLRNSAFNTVGPTGTISILADNCTSGIEPLFAIDYFREVRLQAKGNQTEKTRIVHYPLLKHIGQEVLTMDNKDIIKKYHYIPTHKLDYKRRIKMQAAVQKWTDSSVSSTLNLNKDATIEDIYDIYIKGHEAGLKGMTIFRDGSKKSILTTGCEFDSKEGANIIDIEKYLLKLKEKINEPQRSYRYVEYWKKAKIYLSVTVDETGRPLEIFSNVPYEAGINEAGDYSTQLYMERTSYWHSTCRLTSLLLRSRIPIYMICNQLRKSSPSMVDLPAVILRVLSKYNNPSEEKIQKIKTSGEGGDYCVACKKNGVAYIGGCGVCQICGDTKCG